MAPCIGLLWEKTKETKTSFHWRLSHGHVVWGITPPSCFTLPHTRFILCNGFQCVSKPGKIHSMPQRYLMPVYQLCLFQSLFSENMIVIKVSIKNWKLIFQTALLWVAFGMRGIASLQRDLQGSSQDYLDTEVGVTHLFPDFAASLFIFQRLLVSSLLLLSGDFCEIYSRKQKLV